MKREASKVQVFSDATITVPLVVQALRASGKEAQERVGVRLEGKRAGAEVRKEVGGVLGLTTFFLDGLPGAIDDKAQNVHWANSRKRKAILLVILSYASQGDANGMWL